MLTTKPCTATFVIDGNAMTVTFYPDNGMLRIHDAAGACLCDTRWRDSWRALLQSISDVTDRAELAAFNVDPRSTQRDLFSGDAFAMAPA